MAKSRRGKPSIAKQQAPPKPPAWYDRTIFWGGSGTAITLTLTAIGGGIDNIALSSWLLIGAWPFWGMSAWALTRGIKSKTARVLLSFMLSTAVAASLFSVNAWIFKNKPHTIERARLHIFNWDFRLQQMPMPRKPRAVFKLAFENTGTLDANVKAYFRVDFEKVTNDDIETAKIEDKIQADLVSYMKTAVATVNVLPAGGQRWTDPIPVDFTDEQWNLFQSGSHAIYYSGAIVYKDKFEERTTNFCVSKTIGDPTYIVSCKKYNTEP